eukprot:sb/3475880/
MFCVGKMGGCAASFCDLRVGARSAFLRFCRFRKSKLNLTQIFKKQCAFLKKIKMPATSLWYAIRYLLTILAIWNSGKTAFLASKAPVIDFAAGASLLMPETYSAADTVVQRYFQCNSHRNPC